MKLRYEFPGGNQVDGSPPAPSIVESEESWKKVETIYFRYSWCLAFFLQGLSDDEAIPMV